MMRRLVLIALGLSFACLSVPKLAQQTAKMPSVGVLSTNARANDSTFDNLRGSLRDLGYEEGSSISPRIVSAEGHLERLPTLAAELVDQCVHVIVATNEVSTRAARKATAKIPIVMAGLATIPLPSGQHMNGCLAVCLPILESSNALVAPAINSPGIGGRTFSESLASKYFLNI